MRAFRDGFAPMKIFNAILAIKERDIGGRNAQWDKKERVCVLTFRGEKSAKNIPLNILFFGD